MKIAICFITSIIIAIIIASLVDIQGFLGIVFGFCVGFLFGTLGILVGKRWSKK